MDARRPSPIQSSLRESGCAAGPSVALIGIMRYIFMALMLPMAVTAQVADAPLRALPASATAQLVESLDAARQHMSHVWRDTPAMNEDGTVNAYVEIPRGELRKWEFDMKANARAIDRVMPHNLGGYPVNYG